ncbi:hypothetical protein GCM10009682_51100 [Luedemannella flava]|uniref:GPP34 family phosphoprotein n=1 Tax=Luedemannella flava TaxID=349316 RepID=A0ABN2MFK7_9ACTN
MAAPASLPQRVFMLAYDPDKGRVRFVITLGAMLRAAALADLYVSGHLADERDRPAVKGRRPCDDPVLDALLDEIAGSKPRSWQSWISRRQRATVGAVRQQLSDGGWARLEPRRFLGLFPTTRVTMRDPRARKELVRLVSGALRDPIGRVDPRDAALVAILSTGNVSLVLDRRTRATNKRRIEELTRLTGPIAPALRTWMQNAEVG